MFGVCCTVPSKPTTTKAPEEARPANPVPPNWPPPIPTHPPDHTIPPLPTHPPSPGFPGIVQPQPPTTPSTTTTTTGIAGWPPTTKPTLPPWATQPTTKPTLPPWATQPTTKPTLPPWATQPTTTTTPVDQSCGAKNGYQDQERIVGGQNAELGEWPWIVS
ncbi:hypothetical protein O3M35_004039 [Rhynocoris fuscipes]|uniref:Uncharacterized protein n=1 Tax=Rhynocoris fuscipes TaxID=488301 RepID=A0AAW1CI44_9HEMI